MTLEQNKQVALEAFRVIETGDAVAADRIIAPDFINREADDDPNRPDRGPAKSWSIWHCGTISACCVNSVC